MHDDEDVPRIAIWIRGILIGLACAAAAALAYAAPERASRSQAVEGLLTSTRDTTPTTDGQAVVVVIEAGLDAISDTQLTALGGTPRYRFRNLIEVSGTPDRLLTLLDRLPASAHVRLPYPHAPTGVVSQGVALTGAGDEHLLANAGAGTAIGIIDVGFGGLSQSQAAGELPLTLTVTDYTGLGSGGTNHGTNVSEIVHDMAPEATLYLAKIGSEVQMAQAVTDMAAAGVRTIVHSTVWFGAAFYDGTGPLCDIAASAASANIQWVNGVGNHRLKHYLAGFTDSNGDLRHEFAAGQNFNTINLAANSPVSLFLNWDAYPRTQIDYDLLLYNGNPDAGGVLVASSTNKPGGGPLGAIPPLEIIDYMPSVTGTYYIVVRKAGSGTAHLRFTLFSNGPDLIQRTTASSILQPADCPEVIGVGATDLNDVAGYFSSEGPTTDGRMKPEVTGPYNVSTSFGNFGGTSASTPHVGGAVALLMARHPGETNAQVRQRLFDLTRDVHAGGMDSRTGYGRISLDADQDGANHDSDNCTLVANTDQRDTNGDGYGNRCDGDLNNDGTVNNLDLGLFKQRYGGTDPDADFNGDGSVNNLDLGLFKQMYGKPPGPSGLHPL